MRAIKHFILAIALIGASGIFLPLLIVHSHGFPVAVTARELSFGFERTHKVLDFKLPSIAESRLSPDLKSTREDVRMVAAATKWAFALYAPLIILMLVGIGAQVSGRLSRGAAAIALVTGAIMIASWFVLRYAVAYGLSELALKRTTIDLAPGAHILIIVGAVAAIGGLIGTIRPEAKSTEPTGFEV